MGPAPVASRAAVVDRIGPPAGDRLPEIAQLVQDSANLGRDAFRERRGVQAGYMTASNAWFEKIAAVPARFNRLIFYSGMTFHAADIAHPERLSAAPRSGRLTLNGFFTCRRNLA